MVKQNKYPSCKPAQRLGSSPMTSGPTGVSAPSGRHPIAPSPLPPFFPNMSAWAPWRQVSEHRQFLMKPCPAVFLFSQQIGSVCTACLAMKLLPWNCKLLQKKLTLSMVSVKATEKALAPTAHPNYSPSGNTVPWGGETLLLPGI